MGFVSKLDYLPLCPSFSRIRSSVLDVDVEVVARLGDRDGGRASGGEYLLCQLLAAVRDAVAQVPAVEGPRVPEGEAVVAVAEVLGLELGALAATRDAVLGPGVGLVERVDGADHHVGGVGTGRDVQPRGVPAAGYRVALLGGGGGRKGDCEGQEAGDGEETHGGWVRCVAAVNESMCA